MNDVNMVIFILYVFIAVITALLYMMGYYNFLYYRDVKKTEIAIEWAKAIGYGITWPLWLIMALIDYIKED